MTADRRYSLFEERGHRSPRLRDVVVTLRRVQVDGSSHNLASGLVLHTLGVHPQRVLSDVRLSRFAWRCRMGR